MSRTFGAPGAASVTDSRRQRFRVAGGRIAGHPRPRIAPVLDTVTHTHMDTQQEVLRALDEVLSLGGRAMAFGSDTPLLGAVPELDSMAVVSLITTLEERFGISVDDDDIDGATFATVGSLTAFVAGKL